MCSSVLRLFEIVALSYHHLRFKCRFNNMLTLEERINVKELLSGLELDDLLSLSSTVTKGLIKPNNREDANEAILQHSDSVESILNRKKVSRELIFNYLHWKKVTTESNLDKKSLMNLLASYWKEQIKADCTSQTIPPKTKLNGHNNSVKEVSLTSDLDSVMVDQLAHKFTEWFFQMINKDFLEGGNFALGPEHFWIDALLHLQMSSNGEEIIEEVSGSGEVVRLIAETKQRHKLYFSPNLSTQGVRGRAEPHGMVSVLACGTLHQSAGVVVGMFEQMFYLIRDPLTNNAWKIKRTQLNLTSKNNVTALPTLNDGDLTRPLLPIENPD